MAVEAGALFSHQVDILYDFQPTPICTGTIVSSYLILTVASCLVNKSMLKLTVQTQNLPRLGLGSKNEEEWERETRYVEDFYTIKALGPNGTFKEDYELAIIILDEELEWSEGVKKAKLLRPTEKYLQLSQPYKCFDKGGRPAKVGVQNTDFSNCMKNADVVAEEDFLMGQIFPPSCISDTPESSESDLVCPAPLPGSGLFCQKTPLAPSAEDENQDPHPENQAHENEDDDYQHYQDLDQSDENQVQNQAKDSKIPQALCGILSSDSDGPRPVYINLAHYLHGIYLPNDPDDNANSTKFIEPVAVNGTDDLVATAFGGVIVEEEESFPYQLSLQERRKGVWQHICGAVLLDERTALTAAHCIPNKAKPTSFQVVAGMRTLDGTGNGNENNNLQILPVQRITPHENYQGSVFLGFDIALVTVDGSFVLNETKVYPVWISSPDEPVLSDFNGTATGWGNFDNTKILSNDLTKVDLPLLPFKRCKEMLHFFKESMTCARTGYSNVCGGDSGGPLVLKNHEFPNNFQRDILVGISSFGPKECEDVKQPSAFTKVSSYYGWIHRNWKRNANTVNKFTCFNGEEISAAYRCDEESDCADGSDEKGCNIKSITEKDRPKTRRCGGEIQLQTEEHDIIYRVESSKPGKMAQCVWTIYNRKNNPIELRLLNNIYANFDPKQNQLIALHNFTLQNFNTQSITQIGQKRRIVGSYTTLIFRGPAGIRDSGFHLRLKSVGNSAVNNPLKFKRVDLKPASSRQTHAYPPNNDFYGVNERVFTVLTPVERGGRIKLNVTMGAMEKGRDWFDIISIGKQPKSLFRFSERKGRMFKAVQGERDEILIVFMSTDSSDVKRKGIQFSYFEDHPTSFDAQEIGCGGNLSLSGNADLFYEANPSKSSCVWVISNSRAGSSRLTLLDSRSQLFNLTDGTSSLYLIHNFTRRDNVSDHINEFGRVYSVDQPFFVLYFRSSPFSTTTGFFLKLRYLPSTSSSPFSLLQFSSNLTPNSSQSQNFSYPNSKPKPNSQGSAIILVQPTRNDRKVQLNLKNIHLTDVNEEWLDILTFRERPVSIYRTSGSRNLTGKSFVSSEGEPFVIYLKSKSNPTSNSRRQKKSLTFSYSEQKENLKPTQSCGGVINLGRRHKISYRAPPGQRSHCLWIVHNAHGPHSNITVTSFDGVNSQLIMLQNRKITNLVRSQTIKTESSVVALLFRSNGNATVLTINLDGVSDFGSGALTEAGENALEVRTIALATSGQMDEFSYPPPPALNYENNERVFILINPEQRGGAGAGVGAGNGNESGTETGNKIQLNLTFVDTEPRFDKLEMFTFRRNPNHPNEIRADASNDVEANRSLQRVFEFASFGTWTDNTFLGELDEPFLLYFHSDSSTVKSGFKFNYTNIPSNGV